VNAVALSHLVDEAWTPSSLDAVVLEFLRAEWNKFLPLLQHGDRCLVDQSDLSDAAQNAVRLELLLSVRHPLLERVPPDTRWFEVRYLGVRHFWQLRNIHHIHWSGHSNTNELLEIAQVRPEKLRGEPGGWPMPILWGHDQGGPFTILEGNHRLTALAGAAARWQDLRMPALVGLSATPCWWHRPDGLW
jgi:hypothetical protein